MKQTHVSYSKGAGIHKMTCPNVRSASGLEAEQLEVLRNQLLSKLTVGFSQTEGSLIVAY